MGKAIPGCTDRAVEKEFTRENIGLDINTAQPRSAATDKGARRRRAALPSERQAMTVEEWLRDTSVEPPCGPNLEYDDRFMALVSSASGKPEQQYGNTIIPAEDPDWEEHRRPVDAIARPKQGFARRRPADARVDAGERPCGSQRKGLELSRRLLESTGMTFIRGSSTTAKSILISARTRLRRSPTGGTDPRPSRGDAVRDSAQDRSPFEPPRLR